MSEIPVDLAYLRERLTDLAAELRDEEASRAPSNVDHTDPGTICDALLQLIDVLSQLEEIGDGNSPDDKAANREIDTLGEFGLHLIEELALLARQASSGINAGEIEHLCVPFSLWIVRHGGEIRNLAPVVNALAYFANQHSRPALMTALHAKYCEIIEASSPASQENAAEEPTNPYRLLLLNRAIVATRSHNPELIESAFDSVLEILPNDAQAFFAEAMEQMALTNYPEHVRIIVRRYFLVHTKPRQLH
jgi:hypothetical protein